MHQTHPQQRKCLWNKHAAKAVSGIKNTGRDDVQLYFCTEPAENRLFMFDLIITFRDSYSWSDAWECEAATFPEEQKTTDWTPQRNTCSVGSSGAWTQQHSRNQLQWVLLIFHTQSSSVYSRTTVTFNYHFRIQYLAPLTSTQAPRCIRFTPVLIMIMILLWLLSAPGGGTHCFPTCFFLQ